MLFFNFHGGPLIILLLSVFIQVSILERYNFQCASFHEYDTLSFKIIFKGIPDAILNSPTLIYLNMKDGNINNYFKQISFNSATHKEYENVVLTPSNGSLLYVNFYYRAYPNKPIKKPLMRFVLQKNDVDVPFKYRNCSSPCVIEFDDWEFGDQKHFSLRNMIEKFLSQEKQNANNPQLVDGPQKIRYRPRDQVNIEAVYLYNIPREAHYVELIQSNNNQPVENAGNGEVKEQPHVFNNFSYTLLNSYDGFKILLRLNSSKNNKDEFREIVLLHFIEDTNKTTKHPCLDKCIIAYDFKPVNKSLSELVASAVCPIVETSEPIQRTTSKTTEGTKTSTRLTTITTDAGKIITTNSGTTIKTDSGTTITRDAGTTITTDAGTTITTDAGTTITTDAGTTINPNVRTALKTTDVETKKTDHTGKILAIVFPIVAVVLVILILAGIYWYRRNKAREPETEDTYFYATQLNYAQLELESSDLYEAPKKDYVSVYTRIIGVLKPKSST